MDYENVSREAGTTKWRLRDLFNYGLDGVISFNYRPLRLSIWFGLLVMAVAIGYAAWVLWEAALHGNSAPGYVTIICAVTGFGGVQLILLGVIGEYLGRIYAETKRRPLFLLRRAARAAPYADHGRARTRPRRPRPRRTLMTTTETETVKRAPRAGPRP